MSYKHIDAQGNKHPVSGGYFIQQPVEEVQWSVWQTMTDAQKEGHRWKILNAPSDALSADKIWYDENDSTLSVKDKIDSKVSKSGDTINGNVYIKQTTSANSSLELGNASSNSYGLLTLYDGGTGYRANLYASGLSNSRSVVMPNKEGTLLVDSDVKIIKASSGSSNNAVVTVPSTPYGTFEIVSPTMVYVGVNNSSGAVSQVKGVDGTTLTVSGNNVTVPVGSYYRTAVLKFYGSAAF